ncbi:hypothetical protein SRABI80_04829 [Peribacillus frigoritolerans]|nr:hypothetical protein SRABI80_04829 [Peribacillus frigoritolerans]
MIQEKTGVREASPIYFVHVYIPTAVARCFLGNHSDTHQALVGMEGDSKAPSPMRYVISDDIFFAVPTMNVNTDHKTRETVYTFLGPNLSRK